MSTPVITASEFQLKYSNMPPAFRLSYHGIIVAEGQPFGELQPSAATVARVTIQIHGCRPLIEKLKSSGAVHTLAPASPSYLFFADPNVHSVTPNKKAG